MLDNDQTKNIGLRGITVADTKISMVDGKAGNLFYHGFKIQDLAQNACFEEIIHLLLTGLPPKKEELSDLKSKLAAYRCLPPEIEAQLKNRPRTAGPMDVMQSTVSALADLDKSLLSTERDTVFDSCLRLIAMFCTTAMAWQRIRNGKQPVAIEQNQSHAAAFLQGLWDREPSRDEEKLMDLLLVLHADHTFNASTFAVREVASTQAHLYAAVGAGVGALSGPLHGGANAKVMAMLLEIADLDNVEPWIDARLASGQRIMGLGHAVYTTEDPRAGILRKVAKGVLDGTSAEKWFTLGLKVEQIGRAALRQKKKMNLYPNVDFYSSPVLYGLGLPVDMFPVFFAISRVSGWCAHYLEERFAEAQPKPAIYRPRANYIGQDCGIRGCNWPEVQDR